MALLQSQAVVLHVRDHGDSDKIVTLYTKSRGRVSAIAKGAKRSKKRFVNKLEIFTLLDLYYAESRSSSLVRLDQAEIITHFPALRTHVDCYTAASLVCELIYHWAKENDADENLFQLLAWTLEKIALGNHIPRTLIYFLTKMLGLLGFRPQLEACCLCGGELNRSLTYWFNPAFNGIICNKCSQMNEKTQPSLSLETIMLLLKAQDMNHEKIERLRFSPSATKEALTLLRYYDNHLLQRDIHSWNFLQLTA